MLNLHIQLVCMADSFLNTMDKTNGCDMAQGKSGKKGTEKGDRFFFAVRAAGQALPDGDFLPLLPGRSPQKKRQGQ